MQQGDPEGTPEGYPPREPLHRVSAAGRARVITPTEVIGLVGGYYGIGVSQLRGERRLKTVAWPRQILMYLLRTDLRLPLEEVGRLLGGRDHSTVLHAESKVKMALVDNYKFQAEMAELRRKIFNGGA